MGNGWVLPVSIGIIMWGIGLQVTLASFGRVFTQPKAILTGLLLQMILLPGVAFLLAYLLPLAPEYQVGLIIIAACPGGTASNLVTHILRGRVALSISLTSFNSILILFTIPLLVNLALQEFMDQSSSFSLSMGETVRQLGLSVLLPVALGVAIRHWRPHWAEVLRKPLKFILPALLLVAFGFAAWQSDGSSSGINWAAYGRLLLPTLLLNMGTILLGFGVAWLLKIKTDGRMTIAIEMGLQNSALAIFVAQQVLQNAEMARVALVYSSFSFFLTAALAWVLRQLSHRN